MPKCTRCSCYKNNKKLNCVPFKGSESPIFYFLTETSLTLAEEERFNKLLKIAGIDKEIISVAPSHRCYKSSKPTDNELNACFIHTFLEVQELNPQLVVVMGEAPLYLTTGLKGVKNYQSKLLWSDKLNKKILVTFPIANSFYDNFVSKALLKNFKSLQTLLNQEVKEIRNYTYEEVTEVPQTLFQADTLYIDTETTGLNPYTDELKIVQVSDGKEPVYIFNSFPDDLKQLLKTKNIVGQGWSFDAKFLKTNLDTFPENWEFDTCLAEYLLTGTKDNDLTYLVSKYAPESFGYDTSVYQKGGAHKVTDKDELYQYAANDVGVLPNIKEAQTKLLQDNGMFDLYHNLILPTNKILTKMSLRGILVDVERVHELDNKYKKMSDDLLSEANKLPEVIECEKNFNQKFNPRSTPMLRWLLLEKYKLPILKINTTSKGEKTPVLDSQRMKIYADKYKNQYCKIMEKYRSYQTLRENFLSGLLPKLINNVAHTTYSLHSTETGRPNSRNPNLLNLPGAKETEEIRTCFIARPEHIFVYADLSQIEVKVAAIVYDEPKLVKICNGGRDFHCEITSRLLGLPYERVKEGYDNHDEEITHKRRIFKTITFSILYGMGAESLAVDLEISMDDANKFIDDYFRGFPDLKRNIDECKKEVIRTGSITNLFGFRRLWKYHTENDHNTLREAINFPVQSVAWNLLELGMIKADQELSKYNIPLIMQVYDSLGAESREEDKKKAGRIMKKSMQTCNYGIPKLEDIKITADVEMGYNLKDLKKMG